MGATCKAYGGCDFILNNGDSFYDLGITQGVTDPQWNNTFVSVFNAAGIPAGTPVLSTLGNHDYKCDRCVILYSTFEVVLLTPARFVICRVLYPPPRCELQC